MAERELLCVILNFTFLHIQRVHDTKVNFCMMVKIFHVQPVSLARTMSNSSPCSGLCPVVCPGNFCPPPDYGVVGFRTTSSRKASILVFQPPPRLSCPLVCPAPIQDPFFPIPRSGLLFVKHPNQLIFMSIPQLRPSLSKGHQHPVVKITSILRLGDSRHPGSLLASWRLSVTRG